MLERLCCHGDMAKSKRPRDTKQLATHIVDPSTGQVQDPPSESDGKNPHAVALGRIGGLKGGNARAEKLSKKRRSEIAKKAAKARWQAKE